MANLTGLVAANSVVRSIQMDFLHFMTREPIYNSEFVRCLRIT